MTRGNSIVQHEELKKVLAKDRERRAFDPQAWLDRKADTLNEYCRKNGLKACVISVSGGVDSAVTLAIADYARNREGSPIERVVGVAQPIHSTEKIWKRALELSEAYKKVEIFTVDQTTVFDQLKQISDKAIGINGGDFASGQLRSYMRTPVGFYTAQLLSQNGTPAIVLGTGNKDEDGYLYYFCKAGDGIADVQLIHDLHKHEVFVVGELLKVPSTTLDAPPSADLWDGQTDEEELGFSYDFVELWTEYLEFSEDEKALFRASLSEEARKEFDSNGEKAATVHRRNKHKDVYPLNL
ncbi:NAD+ synthase NadE [Acrasis kona]|uniref:NAD+ synthase NadE n=1 Tax=Acrasis kona TaxID=1008807 RepID=A0AAW2ZEX4_9EUKA